jgi:hypothetical protein
VSEYIHFNSVQTLGGVMAAITAQFALSQEDQTFADRTIVAHSGKPGALLGILQQIQEHHPHKYPYRRHPGIRGRKGRYSAGPNLQRGDILRSVQPGPAGRT